jgi:hypothetical protein
MSSSSDLGTWEKVRDLKLCCFDSNVRYFYLPLLFFFGDTIVNLSRILDFARRSARSRTQTRGDVRHFDELNGLNG